MKDTTQRKRAPGAGRKRFYDEATERGTITLPPSLWKKARELSGGNASAGIRRALEAWKK